MTLLALAAIAPLLSLSCKQAQPPAGFGVDLMIDLQALSQRSAVASVDVTASGAEAYDTTIVLSPAILKAGLVRVRYVPGVMTGSMTFNVAASTSMGVVVGSGFATASLIEAHAVVLTIPLTDVAPSMDGGMPLDMLPAHCSNATKDVDETDVDCGGSCGGCEPDKSCLVPHDCATATCMSMVCELASGPPSWLTLPALPAGRSLGGAWGADDGVYVAGGVSPDIDGTTLVFDGTLNAWCGTCTGVTPAGSLMVPRQGFGYAYTGGMLYALAGYNSSSGTGMALTSIERFDVTTQKWSALTAQLGTARANLAAAVGGDGLIYLVGGETLPSTVVNIVESFDPVGMTVKTEAILPAARQYLGAADDAKGRVVVVGGNDQSATSVSEVDIYDTTAQKWSPGPALPSAVNALGVVRGADNRVYAFGGHASAGVSVATTVALTPDVDHWTPVAPMSVGRAGINAARGWDGRIYACGGVDKALDPTVEAYGPVITLGPETNGSVAISLANFAANAHVTVTLTGGTINAMPIAEGTSDATGAVKPSLAWRVPAGASGSYTLTATDNYARYPVRALFTAP